MPAPEFLKRRNALWQRLRTLPPGSDAFAGAVAELSALTGWDRARVLAGLGLTDATDATDADAAANADVPGSATDAPAAPIAPIAPGVPGRPG